MKRLIAMTLMALPLAWATAPLEAQAQKKMYKCGSQFQDRPCEGTAPAAKGAPAPMAAPAPAAAPVAAKSSNDDARRQIRCDNWQRQVDDLTDRAKSEQNTVAAQALANQRTSLLARMKGDSCEGG
jgi:hypothetical protein